MDDIDRMLEKGRQVYIPFLSHQPKLFIFSVSIRCFLKFLYLFCEIYTGF